MGIFFSFLFSSFSSFLKKKLSPMCALASISKRRLDSSRFYSCSPPRVVPRRFDPIPALPRTSPTLPVENIQQHPTTHVDAHTSPPLICTAAGRGTRLRTQAHPRTGYCDHPPQPRRRISASGGEDVLPSPDKPYAPLADDARRPRAERHHGSRSWMDAVSPLTTSWLPPCRSFDPAYQRSE